MLNVAVMMIMLAVAASVAVFCRYAIAAHQARSAADLAALAGAQAYGSGADGCRTAAQLAKANAGRVVSCRVVGGAIDFVISVRVAVEVEEPALGLPPKIVRTGYAGPVR